MQVGEEVLNGLHCQTSLGEQGGKGKRIGRRVEEVEGRVLRVEVVAKDRVVEVGNRGHAVGEGLIPGDEVEEGDAGGGDMIMISRVKSVSREDSAGQRTKAAVSWNLNHRIPDWANASLRQ
ncbi:hypothetical protein B0H13DRAFT_1879828 [Mycena leptocephala]|nr:hypothetical protein B0H13DRAFT_1879828 [Mycena leptocephala]